MDNTRMSNAVEESEYKNFSDEYYIDMENKSPENKEVSAEDAFSDSMFSEGFFIISPEGQKYKTVKPSEKSGSKKENTGFMVKI